MTLRISSLLLLLAATSAAAPERLGFDPSTSNGLASAASIYFAPENSFLFRMRNPDGSYREFQKSEVDSSAPVQKLWSPRGWKGALRVRKGLVYVESGGKVKGGRAVYLFNNGSLVQFEQAGKVHRFPANSPRPPTAGGVPYYFGDEEAGPDADGADKPGAHGRSGGMTKEVQRELRKKWAKSGRLRWPFDNPNENGFLYLSLALLSSYLFFFSRRGVRIAGGVCFAAASAALVMTASRGSFLAFAAGLAPLVALNFAKVVKSKAVWVLAGVVLLSAVAWFATHDSKLLSRGFSKKSRWSNETRIEMWATAPQMIAEAPNGWGEMHVGRAYMDWYDSLSRISLSGSLINDHLTKLVGYSRIGRFTYLFVWFGLLSLTAYAAARTRRAVALGVLLALAVASWFNAVLMNIFIWGVPVAAIALFAAERPWRVWRARTVGIMLGGSALLAVAVLAGLSIAGGSSPSRGYPIHVVDGQVRVKNRNPSTWIVDDGRALGGVLSCCDIRRFYAANPSAPGVGYVRSVENLPKKVRRLVLAGSAGDEWLRRMSEGGVEAQRSIPEEVVFITPPFPPSALPEPFLKSCKVRLVIGEFVARYFADEYGNPPPWVTVVPGMELYIDGWMRFVVN